MKWILYKKYELMPEPVKASFWFIISNVLIRGISIITLPIFSRILLPEEYGTIYVYQTWVGIVSIFTTLGLWGGVFKVSIVKFPKDKDKIVSSYQGLATTITVCAGIIAVILRHQLSPLLGIPPILIISMFVEILAQIPINMWVVEEQFEYKYRPVISVTILEGIFIPLSSYICIKNFPGFHAEAKIIGGLIIQIVISLIIYMRNLCKGKTYYDRTLWLFGFTFNIVLIPHYLSTLILGQSDRLMIDKLCGSADTGIYSIAYTFAMLITIVSNAIESTLTPYIYKAIKFEDTKKLIKQTNTIILLMATLMVFMMCLIPDVFMIMLPESYYQSIWAIPPIIAGAFFMFLYPLFGSIEFYYKENKFVTIASCIGAVLNITLNYIFINLFGYIAAAYTTLVCYILFAISHYQFMKLVLKKNQITFKIYDIKFISIISIMMILITIIAEFVYNYFMIRWVIIIVCLMACILFKKKIIEAIKGFIE